MSELHNSDRSSDPVYERPIEGEIGRPVVVILCDHCPCLNSDIEEGSWCNLGFEAQYTKCSDGRWKTISKDCELISIKTKDDEFTPTKLKDDLSRAP